MLKNENLRAIGSILVSVTGELRKNSDQIIFKLMWKNYFENFVKKRTKSETLFFLM